ncbi:MAG: Hsp70 family protein [Holosporaceae bacterium]|jgi:molecular chaperone HscA|nr:Hsp70 family protein [Holosporaceae bacterium]
MMFTLGIDLGTTMSLVSHMDGGIPRILEIEGKTAVPSVVNYSGIEPIVGYEAIYKADAANTVFSIKRFMGTSEKFCDRNAVEISADILAYLKNTAEQKLRRQIDGAIITVPAHFSDLQRVATQQAAFIAGINVLRLINEPTAAAIAFGLDQKTDGIFAVYDFGGGTFDFSVLRLSDGVFQVLATGGDNYLGGDDVDTAILDYNLRIHGLDSKDLRENEKILGKLTAKELKEQLGDRREIRKKHSIKNESYEFALSQEILTDLMKVFLRKTTEIADETLSNANVAHENLDGVVLVGGMTKLPLLKKYVTLHFGAKILDGINPEEAVARGAAIYAHSIANRHDVVKSKTNAPTQGPLLIDVVPLTLGIETFGGAVDKVIHRNTPIPIVEKREYTTYQNNQTGIKFHVLQGERPLANECRSLARFELSNIPPMPAGQPRVIVEFSIDVNGVLSVKAQEENTHIMQSIVVKPSSGLSDQAIVSILEKAAAHSETDSAQLLDISIKVESERMLKFWESILEKIPPEAGKVAGKKMSDLQKALDDEKYQEAISIRGDLEKIFGQFLEEIISAHLSGQPLSRLRTPD